MFTNDNIQWRIERGKLCRKLREVMGLKQSDIAKMTDTSQENISKFENGKISNEYLLLSYLTLYNTTKGVKLP